MPSSSFSSSVPAASLASASPAACPNAKRLTPGTFWTIMLHVTCEPLTDLLHSNGDCHTSALLDYRAAAGRWIHIFLARRGGTAVWSQTQFSQPFQAALGSWYYELFQKLQTLTKLTNTTHTHTWRVPHGDKILNPFRESPTHSTLRSRSLNCSSSSGSSKTMP